MWEVWGHNERKPHYKEGCGICSCIGAETICERQQYSCSVGEKKTTGRKNHGDSPCGKCISSGK